MYVLAFLNLFLLYIFSTFLYMKFLMVWALVLMADFILEFRFEYLWPFWLLMRSVYDSFKFQGLVSSNLGLGATKPVYRVSDKSRLKLVSSATETSYKIKISLVASLDMIVSKKQITKALICLRGCAGWSAPLLFANPRRQDFLR